VTTCPDLLTAGTAELAVTLMLALGRRLNEAQRLLREDFQGWRPRLLAPGLAGATAGLLGMGRLGRAVARRLQGFDMALVYHDLHPPPPEDEDALGVVACGLDDLLAESDYVVVLVPLTDRTRGLLGATRIAAMKPGAFLVNCARGSVVDETAVAVALEEGRLGGYGADVFAMEDWRLPDRPRTIPEILLRQGDRVVLTPHIGSAVVETRRRIGLSAAGQIRAVFEGTRPSMAINDVQQREQG
jgi:phosphonate dehydrogenase